MHYYQNFYLVYARIEIYNNVHVSQGVFNIAKTDV